MKRLSIILLHCLGALYLRDTLEPHKIPEEALNNSFSLFRSSVFVQRYSQSLIRYLKRLLIILFHGLGALYLRDILRASEDTWGELNNSCLLFRSCVFVHRYSQSLIRYLKRLLIILFHGLGALYLRDILRASEDTWGGFE